jgi:hypothetical protein
VAPLAVHAQSHPPPIHLVPLEFGDVVGHIVNLEQAKVLHQAKDLCYLRVVDLFDHVNLQEVIA